MQAVKDQSRVPQNDQMHRQLSEHISNLSAQYKGLQKEYLEIKDLNLVQQTKLTDQQLMIQSLKTQLDKEQAHREELQKLISIHRWKDNNGSSGEQAMQEQEGSGSQEESKRIRELQELLVH